MKKTAIIAASILVCSGLVFANQMGAKGLNFLAPSVKSKDQVSDPQNGEVIFENPDDEGQDASFWGYARAEWIQLGGTQNNVPTGTISAFAGSTAPNGYAIANGDAVSRVGTYAALFAVVGTSFGDGSKNADGTSSSCATDTCFNLPDLRGRFLRGVDDGAGRDTDARTAMNVGGSTTSVGSIQADELKSHSHSTPVTNAAAGTGTVGIVQGSNNIGFGFGVGVGSTGGTETRPKNAYVNFIIKL